MAGLQHTREGADGGPTQAPLRSPFTNGTRSARSQPLGVILFCGRKSHPGRARAGHPEGDAQDALKTIVELERQLRSRVYRVYACEEGAEDRWEYFTVLEFDDLQAWNLFEQNLERNGFGASYDYKVRAFGRRLG